jgi:hypothetical protein
MKSFSPFLAAGAALAIGLCAGPALAADNEAGVPLSPNDAAGPWTLESGGAAICTIKLSATKAGQAGFRVAAPASCGDALPAGAAGWTPTADGVALTGSDGKVLIAFNRWSNSLFVSHRSSGADLQLKRGGPGALPGTD